MGASQLIAQLNFSIVQLICKAVNNFMPQWDAGKCEHRGDPTLLWMSPYDVFFTILHSSDPHSDGLPLMAVHFFLESTTDRNHNISTKFIVNSFKKHFYFYLRYWSYGRFMTVLCSPFKSIEFFEELHKSALKRIEYIDNTCIKLCLTIRKLFAFKMS